jgi:hypothetical protein
VCDTCQQAKSHQLPSPKTKNVSKAPLELVFSDVWGPTPSSVEKNNYYISFIDGFSKFTWIFLLKHKSEVFQKFHDFQAHVECLFDHKILAHKKMLKSGRLSVLKHWVEGLRLASGSKRAIGVASALA